MKKLILFSALGLLALTACNRNKSSQSSTESGDSTKAIVADLPEKFYKRLEGEIAGKHVVMNLEKIEYDYSGSYYYDGSWLSLAIDTIIGKDSIVLTETPTEGYEYNEKVIPNTLALKWTGNGFSGKWTSGNKDKSYNIALTEKYPAGSYPFEISTYADSAKAFPNKDNSPSAEIALKVLTTTGKTPADSWINKQLQMAAGLKEGQTNWEAGLKSLTQNYLKEYQKSVKELAREGDNYNFLNYSNHTNQSIVYNNRNYVIVEQLDDDYSGGAHGNYASTFYCLDVKGNKKLTLNDVTHADTLVLQQLLEKNLRKQYHVKSEDQLNTVLFDNYLKPNKNFYFNNNGLAFLYNPYEVASYAQGQIIVFIPFSELKGYLNPNFAQRMNIK